MSKTSELAEYLYVLYANTPPGLQRWDMVSGSQRQKWLDDADAILTLLDSEQGDARE